MTTNSSVSVGPPGSAGLIVLLPSAGPLLPFVLDITKSFYIRELVPSADNTIDTKTLKGTIWIAEVPFSFLDKV